MWKYTIKCSIGFPQEIFKSSKSTDMCTEIVQGQNKKTKNTELKIQKKKDPHGMEIGADSLHIIEMIPKIPRCVKGNNKKGSSVSTEKK